MDSHYIGATPYLHINIVDEDGAAVAPTSVTVSIYDPNGTVMVEDAAMSSTATTGEYYYASWTVLSTHITGVYSWFPKSTDGTIITRNKKLQFIVAREVGDNY